MSDNGSDQEYADIGKEQWHVERDKLQGLALLRKPFPPHQISKLPRPTRAQTDEVKANYKAGIRCLLCGTWHHPNAIHLDYVGHAALTDRLLDCDPFWTWEPLTMNSDGLPTMDPYGGLWIRLTVCGVARLGYGHAGDKQGGDAIKEIIGDALRNAAMRFGAALDLWHKGDLHADEDNGKAGDPPQAKRYGIHKPSDGAMATLTPQQQTYVGKIAAVIGAKMGAGEDWGAYEELVGAIAKVKAQDGDDHMFKIALWDVLSAPIRKALESMELAETGKGKT